MTIPKNSATAFLETSHYRPEIDGLRAIAVIGVVMYHAGIAEFSGGFLGVDIFFVISGYLITDLLLRDFEKGRFSLARFYERRIRRIAPALFVMLAAACVAGAVLLLPRDLAAYSTSVVTAVTFCSNFLFWHVRNDYFAGPATSEPLLHTWSLAVEEQFYLIFPICLIFAERGGRRITGLAIAAVGLASFCFYLYENMSHPVIAFYFPVSRAWELMIGAFLATQIIPSITSRIVGETMDAVGILLVGFALVGTTQAMNVSGLPALTACTGAALLIGRKNLGQSSVVRLLSSRPFVLVGLASYSLYLWHWPMIVFGTYYELDQNQLPFIRIVMALLSIPVAFLSWWFVELPFRKPQGVFPRKSLFHATLIVALLFVVLGIAGFELRGLPGRFDRTTQLIAMACAPESVRCGERMIIAPESKHIVIGIPAKRPGFILWGDSHAGMYAAVFDKLAKKHGESGIVFVERCPPFLHFNEPGFSSGCGARSAFVIRQIETLHPKAVILSARWAQYTTAGRAGDEAEFARRLGETVYRLKHLGMEIYFVSDIPEVSTSVPEALAKAHLLGVTLHIEPSVADYKLKMHDVFLAIGDLKKRGLINVIDPQSILCGPAYCRVTNGIQPLYVDTNHASSAGADLVSPLFDSLLKSLGAH